MIKVIIYSWYKIIDDFQFDTDISYTDELGRKFIENPKSVSEIKKETKIRPINNCSYCDETKI